MKSTQILLRIHTSVCSDSYSACCFLHIQLFRNNLKYLPFFKYTFLFAWFNSVFFLAYYTIHATHSIWHLNKPLHSRQSKFMIVLQCSFPSSREIRWIEWHNMLVPSSLSNVYCCLLSNNVFVETPPYLQQSTNS